MVVHTFIPGTIDTKAESAAENVSPRDKDKTIPRLHRSPSRVEARLRRSSAVAKIGLSTFAIVLIISAVLVWTPARPEATERGPLREAPDFSLPTDGDGRVSLSQFEGRVVVLHFVVLVCCSYSALEIGYMDQVEPAVQDRGVVFLSIAMNSEYNYFSPQEYRTLMRFDWALALDFDGTVQRLYGAVETSTFVIDREGMIRFHDDETTSPATLSGWLQEVA